MFRDRVMCMIAAFCAMRPGEIFGLRWSSWRGDSFQIEGTAWRGTSQARQGQDARVAGISIIPDVLQPALALWRQQNPMAAEDALIFPGRTGAHWLARELATQTVASL